MSRTHRRKNAWNKNRRVAFLLDVLDERFDRRIHNGYWAPKYPKKYRDWAESEVVEYVSAHFHSDSWLDDEIIENLYKKGWNKFLRNKGKHQLVEALKYGEEEDLLPVSKKEITWWYDWAYYW